MLAEKTVVKPMTHVEDFLKPEQKPYTTGSMELQYAIAGQYLAKFFEYENLHFKDPEGKYKDVIDALIKYMSAENIEIMVSPFASYASICFNKDHSKAVLLVDTAYYEVLNAPSLIAVIAHELGHYLDFKHYEKPDKTFLVEIEMVAWALAEDILKAVGFDDFDTFEKVKEFGLMSYVDDNIHKYNFYMEQFDEIVLNHIG